MATAKKTVDLSNAHSLDLLAELIRRVQVEPKAPKPPAPVKGPVRRGGGTSQQ
jgi:hypothetical protein